MCKFAENERRLEKLMEKDSISYRAALVVIVVIVIFMLADLTDPDEVRPTEVKRTGNEHFNEHIINYCLL